jgi:hypothetical protein
MANQKAPTALARSVEAIGRAHEPAAVRGEIHRRDNNVFPLYGALGKPSNEPLEPRWWGRA